MKGSRSTSETDVLNDLVRRIVNTVRPERIVLFGSAARGEMTPGSDLDILAIKAGDYHRGRLTESIYESLRGLGAAVDVVVARPEDINQYGDSPAMVFASALRDGKVPYDA